jgi:hypothetical protein
MTSRWIAALTRYGLMLSIAPAVAECSVEQAVSAVYMRSLDRQADLAKQQLANDRLGDVLQYTESGQTR